MKISIFTIANKEYSNLELCEINFTQTAKVACDSLCFYFKSNVFIEEIDRVAAFDGGNLVFSGICDCQKRIETQNGFENYIYARSSAAVLVDNEALPFTYNCPTAVQLWYSLAKDKGFKNCLPQVVSTDKYEVTKGNSCFAAIRQFVELKTGKVMYVTPENELKCFEKSSDIKSLNDYKVLSCTATVNRSEPVSRLCVKKLSSDTDYKLNMKALVSDEIGIDRVQYLNLQSLPQWQRENGAINKLKSYFEDYKILEIKVSGFVSDSLYQRFSYKSAGGQYDDYILTEKKYTLDKNGEVTRLTLKKEIDIKEITYVD